MRHRKALALLAVSIALPLAAVISAPMPSDSNLEAIDSLQGNQACGMMGSGTMPCGMKCDAFASLEQHFAGMMNMDSMPQLKEEMAKHRQMMMAMHAPSEADSRRCSGRAGTVGGCGMMGSGRPESSDQAGDTGHSSHH